ncbi:MAG TPA: LacI family DNA-binding transcriptional regulator [Aggregatilineaceae bacterium]|nr:LacI family DNA-binding transcriptional regulator [Aggregatilineaceae bacterium]
MASKNLNPNITILDVAREANVSYSTVSRVLSGFEFVKESTKQRVLEAVDHLGYVVNPQARSLAGGKSRVIGLLVPALDNGYINEIVRGIDAELNKLDYDLLLYTTHRDNGKEASYAVKLTKGLADGLLLIVPLLDNTYTETLQAQSFPYVLVDQGAPNSFIVDCTNWQGAYDATQYLIQLGHKRIGFITGLMALISAQDRLDGYRTALLDNGIKFDPDLVHVGNYTHSGAEQPTHQLLDLPVPPTAIFAANDLSAFGTLEAVRARGLRIPEDISIMGFDDIPQCLLAYPQLTTIHQPLEQMGHMAARMLVEQIENPELPPRHITLATKLVIRNSCQAL